MSGPLGQLESPRTVFIAARLPSRHRWRAWAGGVLVLGVLIAAAGVFQTQIERWMLRATFRVIRDDEPKRIDDRLVGRWVSANGGRILISRSGVVWSEVGDLVGRGTFDAGAPTRFTFDGPGFRCLYDLSVKRDVSEWRLLDDGPASSCPQGRFVRAFAY